MSARGFDEIDDILEENAERTNHLFVIGINDYLYYNNLPNAVKDITDFVDLVTKKFDFEKENVTTLFDKNATKRKIVNKLKLFITNLTENDNLIIYFSGHGSYDDILDRGYWIPYNAEVDDETDFLPSSDIKAYLDVTNAHHILVIADSCFSESLFIDRNNRSTYETELERKASRYGLTSGRGLVSDGLPNTNSPFSKSLLKYLSEAEQPIGVQELAHKVSVATHLEKSSQKPHGQPLAIKGHDFGQFVFRTKDYTTDSQEDIDFEKALEENTTRSLNRYLEEYADGLYVDEAKGQLKGIADYEAEQQQKGKEVEQYREWEKILMRSRQRIADYEDYLEDFPKAIFKKQANQMMDALSWKTICDAVEKYQDTQPNGTFLKHAQALLQNQNWNTIYQNIITDFTKHKETLDFKKRLRKPKTYFKKKEQRKLKLDNFVFIKGGTFLMGSPENEVDRADEETQHEVKLSDFYMAKYTVTVEEFEMFINETKYKIDANWNKDVSGNKQVDKRNLVIRVSWNDAKAYAKWLSEKHNQRFDLPTEAQWEYACRGEAGATTTFNTGEGLTTEQGNYNGNYPYNGNSEGKYLEKTTPVGTYEPNDFGLYDMHGNVWEWCNDWYGVAYYEECKQLGMVENPLGVKSAKYRVIRGGSWYSFARNCRSANRSYSSPDYRDFNLGFRLAFRPAAHR